MIFYGKCREYQTIVGENNIGAAEIRNNFAIAKSKICIIEVYLLKYYF